MATELTPIGGGQLSQWAKAGELLEKKRNHAGSIVRITGPRTGLIYENSMTLIYKFGRRGKQRRPEWHLQATVDEGNRLRFASRRAAKNYGLVMPSIDPADIGLMEQSFKDHVTQTREYRRSAKEKNLLHAGGSMSRGAVWVRERVTVSQPQCMFFPAAVCFSRASVRYNYQKISAARAMCLEHNGRPEQQDMVVRHKCGMGHMSCVNPQHLAWGTVKENGRDASLHNLVHYNPADYPASDVAKVRQDDRLVNVIAWDLGIPSALVSVIKLAAQTEQAPSFLG
jgi:hypothetical protein